MSNNAFFADYPKIESPFVRKHGEAFDEYCVTPEITPGYERVFEDPNVLCIEKLDGTNIGIQIQNKQVIAIQNRLNIINPRDPKTIQIMEGLYSALERGYLNLPDGIYYGELIGPKLQNNPYDCPKHIRIPFTTYIKEHLAYKSRGKYPKTFEAISQWFENDIFSIYYRQHNEGQIKKPEGVVFYHPDGKKIAKLRLDMFDRRKGVRHKE